MEHHGALCMLGWGIERSISLDYEYDGALIAIVVTMCTNINYCWCWGSSFSSIKFLSLLIEDVE
jgi:hypothetical protein